MIDGAEGAADIGIFRTLPIKSFVSKTNQPQSLGLGNFNTIVWFHDCVEAILNNL
jgi:hypothetical protein